MLWRPLSFLWAILNGTQIDPAGDQLVNFKENNKWPVGIMTTSAGAPINSFDATSTLNERLITNEHFMDTMSHFVRERIPERVVHAKGAGAFGYFEVTNEITKYCKAKLFSRVGKKTPVVVRFSTIFPERGSADTISDARGFAVKFYTDDGNFDIVGINMPVFALKDPLLFPSFVRIQKKNPVTGLPDSDMFWDFMTLHSESMHVNLMAFSDRGTPDGYRHMPGYGVHTFQIVNDKGEIFFVRFFFDPQEGIKNLTAEEALKIAGQDPDYATRDLYNAIGNRNYPEWKVGIQVLTEDDVKTAGFDVFDTTMILPLDKYPVIPLGRLVLDKNPTNYNAQIEQLAYSPGNLVPGVMGSPDQLFLARRFAYRDAELYRLGANFNKIDVNCPLNTRFTYNRDGVPPVGDNGKGVPVYYPNSFNGPVPYTERNRVELISIVQDSAPNNYGQIKDLIDNGFTDDERKRLIDNVVTFLKSASKFLQDRTVKIFKNIHPGFGDSVQRGLSSNTTQNN